MVKQTANAEDRISLTQLPRGGRGRVSGSTLEPKDAQVLRAMGIRPDAQVEVCRMGEPCIVSVYGACGTSCRIGLAKRLAECVLIDPSR